MTTSDFVKKDTLAVEELKATTDALAMTFE